MECSSSTCIFIIFAQHMPLCGSWAGYSSYTSTVTVSEAVNKFNQSQVTTVEGGRERGREGGREWPEGDVSKLNVDLEITCTVIVGEYGEGDQSSESLQQKQHAIHNIFSLQGSFMRELFSTIIYHTYCKKSSILSFYCILVFQF